MRREWRASRVILAVLLLSLVSVGFYAWSVGPRWRIPVEHLVGFDLKRGLLFTVDRGRKTGKWELHGSDLSSGERKVCLPIDVALNPFRQRPIYVLSSDGNTLLNYDGDSNTQLFDVRKQCHLIFSLDAKDIESIAMSSNGEQLAFLKDFDVHIWDTKNCTRKCLLHMPEGTVSKHRAGQIRCIPHYIQFSADDRYLAVGGDDDAIAVFDLQTGQSIGVCPEARVPLFQSDCRTLVAMPELSASGTIRSYRIESDVLVRNSNSRQIDPEKEFALDGSLSSLFTMEYGGADRRHLPAWIPDEMRGKLEEALGWTQYSLYFTTSDIITGQMRDKVTIRVNGYAHHRASPDGSLLIVDDGNFLSLWDLPPHRSLTCWLICSSLTAFALWVGLPRRRKVSSMTA